MAKNLCDKVSKIKYLRWQFWRIFRWLRHGVLHFFCRPCILGVICKTKWTLFIILRVASISHPFVLQISPWKQGLQKKWSTPRRSQWKILRDSHLRFLFSIFCHRDFLTQNYVKIMIFQKVGIIFYFSGHPLVYPIKSS